MSIPVGKRLFEGPFDTAGEIRDEAGVYVVVCKDAVSGFFLVDVGESDKVRSRLKGHDRADCWARVCTSRYEVPRYGVLYTHGVPAGYRRAIEKEIRTQYQPPCGQE